MNIQQNYNREQQVQQSNSNPFTVESLTQDNCIVYTGKIIKYVSTKKPVYGGLWALGIIILFFISGYALQPDKIKEYNNKVDNLNEIYTDLYNQTQKKQLAYSAYYQSKGYFFQCDKICNKNYEKYQIELRKTEQLENKYKTQDVQIRQYAGLFSEHNVEETKTMFWQKNKEGNERAKQMSYFDFIFGSLRVAFSSNDDELATQIFTFIINVVWNIVINNMITVISFCWNIIWDVFTYSPNIQEGILFLFLALIAAFSWFILYNYVIFLIFRGTINTVIQATDNQQRLQGRNNQRNRQQYINNTQFKND